MDEPLKVVFTQRATKDLSWLPNVDCDRVERRLDAYAAAPASSQHDVQPLREADAFRLRVGDWRVIFARLDGGAVEVLRVAHRREVYR